VDYTYLNLLTREGAVAVEFHPVLEPKHYSAFQDAVRDAETADELRDVVKKLAAQIGRHVEFP
jgi:hypothetical protein